MDTPSSEAYRSIPRAALTQPTPFRISVPESQVQELKHSIASAKLAPETYENAQQDRKLGITRQWLKKAQSAWLEFSWRDFEGHMNGVPNYTLDVPYHGGTFQIHFAALFSEREDAVPLLMLHGWPGSFTEFLGVLERLKAKYTPQTLPYHVVVPSLPGYGFSAAPPVDRDFQLQDCAQILDKLMAQLGFGDGYIVQGGDVGSKVARVLGGLHDRVKAVHLNFCIMPDPGGFTEADYSAAEKEGLVRCKWFDRLGSAYALEHATKPSTIGLVLSTNPMAFLAWVGEKMLDWTDDDLPLATILADVSLYWLTNTIGTSLWPYRQLFTPGNLGAHENPAWHINKPLGFSWFPKEIAPVPRAWIATTGDLVFFRAHEKGGHFAALEQSEVFLEDVEAFVEQVWPVESAVGDRR